VDVRPRQDAKARGSLKLRKPARNKMMNRNFLLILIGALAVLAVGASYMYYQERQSGIDIKINESGISIDGK
jgi:hypothetical protein